MALDDSQIQKYADLLVNFGLSEGKGLNQGDSVLLSTPNISDRIITSIRESVERSGGQLFLDDFKPLSADELNNILDEKELEQYFREYYGRKIKHKNYIHLISKKNFEVSNITLPNKFVNTIDDKEYGKYLREKTRRMREGSYSYSRAYIPELLSPDTCFLDKDDPILEFKERKEQLAKISHEILEPLQDFHVTSEHSEFELTIGDNRRWRYMTGQNIPSYEIFTTPDWRTMNGTFYSNMPIMFGGNEIRGIQLTFKNGVITEFKSEGNVKDIEKIISLTNMDKIGEFSMTDERISPIDNPTGLNMIDENVDGNIHIAIGQGYSQCLKETVQVDSDFEKIGFNVATSHIDLISTEHFTVESKINGHWTTIFSNGRFIVKQVS